VLFCENGGEGATWASLYALTLPQTTFGATVGIRHRQQVCKGSREGAQK